MSEPPLLRIGPFSRASSLSIKALRAYHEAGLLVPVQVDPQSGYRSYSLAQLTDAAVIRRLRDELFGADTVPAFHLVPALAAPSGAGGASPAPI